jgi:hypothetical protein
MSPFCPAWLPRGLGAFHPLRVQHENPADKIERLKDPAIGSRDKDEMLLEFARVRCDCRRNVGALPTDDQIEMMEHE